MREIKFRAWDTYNNKMIPEKGGFYIGSINAEPMGGDDYPLMQYTGLKDKNGKEIYEGDVISYRLFCTEKIKKAKVSWGDYEWTLLDAKDKYVDGISYIKSIFMFPESKQSKVIGNIYENPRLLKEKE